MRDGVNLARHLTGDTSLTGVSVAEGTGCMSVSWPGLRGREPERLAFAALVASVRGGGSRVLVLRGEAGIGKTALLELLLERADGFQVLRAAGVESELQLAYAGLHQLCRPHLRRIEGLPAPQRQALRLAFGLESGDPPDRFLIGLAVLTLLCEIAETQPVLCVVDDAQWLDPTSAQTLEFVGRRLGEESVGLVFAVRQSAEEQKLAGLPEQIVGGLGHEDAAALLASAVPGRLDPRVRDRILTECRGNPLALLELPRRMASDLTFGSAGSHLSNAPLIDRLEHQFTLQLDQLTGPARQLLLAAAAEPVGDLALLWRATEPDFGIGVEAAATARGRRAGLIELRDPVRFRHPLVRSAVYRAAKPAERREVHWALAGSQRIRPATPTAEPGTGPAPRWPQTGCSRRTSNVRPTTPMLSVGWRPPPPSSKASAALTPDPGRRAQRSLAAGQAKATAGMFGEALSLLATAEAGPARPGRAGA